jgi:hypothetical protein
MFSSIHPSLAAVKMRQNLLSHAAFEVVLQVYMRLHVSIFRVRIVAVGPLVKENGTLIIYVFCDSSIILVSS